MTWRTLALTAVLTTLVACGGGAAEKLETAEFEELQNNPTHARELYQEIVRRWPGSPEAQKAEARLRALGTGP
jgi:hypothetical protein